MNVKKIAIILAANLLFSFGTAYFLIPSGMVSGGVTGLAIGLDNGFGIPKDVTVWVMQVVLFLLGYFLSEGLAENWRYAIAIVAAIVSIIPCVLYDRHARRKEVLTYTILRRF